MVINGRISRYGFALALLSLGCGQRSDPGSLSNAPPNAPELVAANTTFAFDLYGQLRKEPGNLIVSPLSISTLLTMTGAGASGETLSEIKSVLHLPNLDQVHSDVAALRNYLRADLKQRGYELAFASCLWANEGFPVLPEYLALTQKHYGAGLERVRFDQPEAAAAKINRWAEDQTHGRIKNVVSPNDFSQLTALVGADAIYFKGKWHRTFDRRWTRDAPFYLNEKESVQVPMMYQKSHFRFKSVKDLSALEMGYSGSSLSMILVLPQEREGLAELEQKISTKWLHELTSGITTEEVIVQIPRFTFNSTLNLVDALTKLGMHRAFDPKSAEFERLTSESTSPPYDKRPL